MKKFGIIATTLLAFFLLWSQRPAQKSALTRDQKKEIRAEERAKRNAAATKDIDSIIMSRSWQFVPSYMQTIASPIRMIYRSYYVNVFPTFMQIYLPYIKGFVNQYVTLLNIDILTPQNYVIKQTSDGWNISFSASDLSGDFLTFEFNITTPSYEVILNITSIRYSTVTYNGTLSGLY